MLNPKFIIEDGSLIIGKVARHKQLVSEESKVKGGGWFRYDDETSSFTFYGKSEDFGKARLEDIRECVINHKVFTNKLQTHDISERFNFKYDIGSEIIDL